MCHPWWYNLSKERHSNRRSQQGVRPCHPQFHLWNEMPDTGSLWREKLISHRLLPSSWKRKEEGLRLDLKTAEGLRYQTRKSKHPQNIHELIVRYERTASCYCRKYKCKYIQLNAKMGEQPVRIFIIKYGRSTHWKVLLTTDTSMNFVRAFELYERRWGIEVIFKSTIPFRAWPAASAHPVEQDFGRSQASVESFVAWSRSGSVDMPINCSRTANGRLLHKGLGTFSARFGRLCHARFGLNIF